MTQQDILDAVATVFNDGCACIKDMLGDNSTCYAHRVLHAYAHAQIDQSVFESKTRDDIDRANKGYELR